MFCCMRASVSDLMALLVLCIFHQIYSFIHSYTAMMTNVVLYCVSLFDMTLVNTLIPYAYVTGPL